MDIIELYSKKMEIWSAIKQMLLLQLFLENNLFGHLTLTSHIMLKTGNLSYKKIITLLSITMKKSQFGPPTLMEKDTENAD
jgi:hypothetical protein